MSFQQIVDNVFKNLKSDNRVQGAQTKEEIINAVLAVAASEFGQAVEKQESYVKLAVEAHSIKVEECKKASDESTFYLMKSIQLNKALQNVVREAVSLAASVEQAKDLLQQ